jgi:hypothetical protein
LMSESIIFYPLWLSVWFRLPMCIELFLRYFFNSFSFQFCDEDYTFYLGESIYFVDKMKANFVHEAF